MTLATARQYAAEIIEQIKPYCSRIAIAGSARRGVPTCKDIEIVADIPRQNRSKVGTILNTIGGIRKGKMVGRYVVLYYKGVNVDIFIPRSPDYFRQLVIRTGSAEYVKRVIATGWVKLGYKGSEQGLVDKQGRVADGWESEQDFYRFLNLTYIKPEERL